MKNCSHQWAKWSRPEKSTTYSPTLGLWTTRLIQFRDCETCGESQGRYVELEKAEVGK